MTAPKNTSPAAKIARENADREAAIASMDPSVPITATPVFAEDSSPVEAPPAEDAPADSEDEKAPEKDEPADETFIPTKSEAPNEELAADPARISEVFPSVSIETTRDESGTYTECYSG